MILVECKGVGDIVDICLSRVVMSSPLLVQCNEHYGRHMSRMSYRRVSGRMRKCPSFQSIKMKTRSQHPIRDLGRSQVSMGFPQISLGNPALAGAYFYACIEFREQYQMLLMREHPLVLWKGYKKTQPRCTLTRGC